MDRNLWVSVPSADLEPMPEEKSPSSPATSEGADYAFAPDGIFGRDRVIDSVDGVQFPGRASEVVRAVPRPQLSSFFRVPLGVPWPVP